MENSHKIKKARGRPNAVDKYVGQRLKVRRSLLGLSQEQFANKTDLTFQQIQKYERGLNRISAGRLFEFSYILDVPVAYFYDGYPTPQVHGTPANEQNVEHSILQKPEILKLVKAYDAIADQNIKKNLLSMLIAISKA